MLCRAYKLVLDAQDLDTIMGYRFWTLGHTCPALMDPLSLLQNMHDWHALVAEH